MGTLGALSCWTLGSEIALNPGWNGSVSGVYLYHFLLTWCVAVSLALYTWLNCENATQNCMRYEIIHSKLLFPPVLLFLEAVSRFVSFNFQRWLISKLCVFTPCKGMIPTARECHLLNTMVFFIFSVHPEVNWGSWVLPHSLLIGDLLQKTTESL